MNYYIYGFTDIGNYRNHNEDAILVSQHFLQNGGTVFSMTALICRQISVLLLLTKIVVLFVFTLFYKMSITDECDAHLRFVDNPSTTREAYEKRTIYPDLFFLRFEARIV
ncbi:MAG: hypothetical protein Q4D35_06595 [Ruminococcus sp.]|nr:hypothetical protein [Ruminococcus sp.]